MKVTKRLLRSSLVLTAALAVANTTQSAYAQEEQGGIDANYVEHTPNHAEERDNVGVPRPKGGVQHG